MDSFYLEKKVLEDMQEEEKEVIKQITNGKNIKTPEFTKMWTNYQQNEGRYEQILREEEKDHIVL